ncbi:MAG TPA: hypothetical protein PK668_27245 [Myxococcota bacterium]|nr:hypothetical protein [Myxococcota bacterium]HRY97223.1 hypothetical protein [Myxococcota bacterium]HSA20658.1 hypothetical protein [Myxococcota bacterium]
MRRETRRHVPSSAGLPGLALALWSLTAAAQDRPAPALRVAAGQDFSCALTADGSIRCWGENQDGRASPPAGAFTDLALSEGFGCGITREAALVCWGRRRGGPSPLAGRFRQVALGSDFGCALAEGGQIACWGDDSYGQASPPPGTFTRLATADWHACALDEAGHAHCWGYNRDRQCAAPADELVDLATSRRTSCGLRTDGTRVCWGERRPALPGKLARIVVGCGLTDRGEVVCEEGSPPAGAFAQISRLGPNLCGLRISGEVLCWGSNRRGERDPPEALAGPAPAVGPAISTRPPGGRIAAGYNLACRVGPRGRAACWGRPELVRGLPAEELRQLAAGENHACGLKLDGMLECWGDDTYGQTLFPSLMPMTDLALGEAHGCSVRASSGAIVCWGAGRDRSGGAHRGQASPPRGEFIRVAAAGLDTCGLRRDGVAICWGASYSDATTRIDGPFVEIALGNGFGCGLSPSGEVRCWGSMQGQPPAAGLSAVRAGYATACGIHADGRVTCWEGSLGDPPAELRFADISLGRNYACGLTTEGATVCWGSAGHGQTNPPR